MKTPSSGTRTSSVRSSRSSLTSMTPAVWFRKTRKRRSSLRSTEEGWMRASSSGSMTIRPSANASRMLRSDRITERHPSDALERVIGPRRAGRVRARLATEPVPSAVESVEEEGSGGIEHVLGYADGTRSGSDMTTPDTTGSLRDRSRGRSSAAEHQLPKLRTRVRFPSPAPPSPAPVSVQLDDHRHARDHELTRVTAPWGRSSAVDRVRPPCRSQNRVAPTRRSVAAFGLGVARARGRSGVLVIGVIVVARPLAGWLEVVVERPVTYLRARFATDHVCGPEVDA